MVEKEPTWLRMAQVMILHVESLNLFGGSPGIRDRRLLKNATAIEGLAEGTATQEILALWIRDNSTKC